MSWAKISAEGIATHTWDPARIVLITFVAFARRLDYILSQDSIMCCCLYMCNCVQGMEHSFQVQSWPAHALVVALGPYWDNSIIRNCCCYKTESLLTMEFAAIRNMYQSWSYHPVKPIADCRNTCAYTSPTYQSTTEFFPRILTPVKMITNMSLFQASCLLITTYFHNNLTTHSTDRPLLPPLRQAPLIHLRLRTKFRQT
jgi:hypothetical protein